MKILAIGDFQGKFPTKLEQRLRKEDFDLIIGVGDYKGIAEFWPYIRYMFQAIKKDEKILTVLKDLSIVYPYEKAICQVLLLPVPKIMIDEIDYETLKSFKSERGMNSLGSTNK